MVDINQRLARAWSRVGPRAMYGQFILELARQDEKVVALSSDLGRSSGLAMFSKELPDRFFNTGIAEQNLVGISSGLARMGYKVFSSTFAPFATLRAGEQVRMNMGYMQEPVKLVGLASGFALGFLGNSHFGIEDIAVMRSIPGITVISPADCYELFKCLNILKDFDYPVYIRLTGGVGVPVVYEDDYEYLLGKAVILRPLERLTVLTHGATAGHALQAIRSLEKDDIRVGLVNMHTLKPLDAELCDGLIKNCEHLLVFEEHSVIGGLGSAIIEYFNSKKVRAPAVHCFGVKDCFPKTGSYEYMLETLGLNAYGIEASIREILSVGD